MKLDRNISKNHVGKYALVCLRKVPVGQPVYSPDGTQVTIDLSAVDFGEKPDSEFFVIRLKDQYAAPALKAYAKACAHDDPEFSKEVLQLAHKAQHHPAKRKPD
jgi:hypothetical protein